MKSGSTQTVSRDLTLSRIQSLAAEYGSGGGWASSRANCTTVDRVFDGSHGPKLARLLLKEKTASRSAAMTPSDFGRRLEMPCNASTATAIASGIAAAA